MNNQQFQSHWTTLQPKIKQKWSKFSDLDLKGINGQRDKFATQLQQKYGISKDQAEKEIQELGKTLVGAATGTPQKGGAPQQKGPQNQTTRPGQPPQKPQQTQTPKKK